ncbi:ICP22 family protein [Paenibacillus massiliensis]|uniref:hypothetical protein n=1 Tax=Paenibacillus massiliensis TaxID=225917 RepID=UPI0003F5BD6D|nr:hypothetical protein [Paenibacillus massiliensis]
MGKDFIQFMATTDKKIVFGDKDVEFKLTIPSKVARQHLEFLTSSLNKEIQVLFGDPQASFDFGEREEEQDAMYKKWQRHTVTTDASGVVEKIERDENQAELKMEGDEADELGTEDNLNPDGEQTEGEGDQQQEQTEPPAGDDSEHSSDPNDPYGDNDGDDLPDWMKDGGGSPDNAELEFVGDDETSGSAQGDGEEPPTGSDEVPNDDEGSDNADGDDDPSGAGEIDKEVLEKYILEHRPTVPEITLDIPAAIERKRGGTETWREIASSMGISQGKLTTAVSKYKSEVKKQLAGSGVA